MAQAPTTDDAAHHIARIDRLTDAGRVNWFGLMAYLVFVFITMLGVEDADFFIPSRQTQLPLVNVAIPTESFFVFAPILGAALYVYLHLTVRKITGALCAAPPTVDGMPLEHHLKPWLLVDLVLRLRRDDAIDRRPLDTLAAMTVVALVWLAGPLVLGAMWVRTWPAHDAATTVLAALSLMATVYAGIVSWGRLHRDLRGDTGHGHATSILRDLGILFLGMAVLNFGWIKTETGVVPSSDTGWWSSLSPAQLAGVQFSALPPDQADPTAARQRYRAEWCARLGIPADVCGSLPTPGTEPDATLSDRRGPWCQQQGIAKDGPTACRDWFAARNDDFRTEWTEYRQAVIAALPKPDLSGRDLRGADMSEVEAVGVNLSNARMEGADLRGARMEGAVLLEAGIRRADLRRARLEGANLAGARMERAVLIDARMAGADLRSARMEGAVLERARLAGADLTRAGLAGAVLVDADMRGTSLRVAGLEAANLRWARMEGAVLTWARMAGADLREARMAGADLSEAWMEGAKLRDAHLQNADLRDARLQRADLGYALMEGADLSGAQLQEADLRHAQGRAAHFNGARLQGADLSAALLERAVLVGTRMEGALLSRVRMADAIWAGAVTAANPARFADLRGGVDLDQTRLSSLIGNAATLLPTTPDGKADLYIPSCWDADPPRFDHFVAGQARSAISERVLRDPARGFFCAPGEVPRKTGTPWPVGAPPPWGAQADDESDGDYRLRVDAWVAKQPPGDPID